MTVPSDTVALLCTVRDCRTPLGSVGRGLACLNGHAFDRARSGYVNLLQPQDRRSASPGDSKEAVAARRRLVAAGYEAPIVDEVVCAVVASAPRPGATALDVGCG